MSIQSKQTNEYSVRELGKLVLTRTDWKFVVAIAIMREAYRNKKFFSFIVEVIRDVIN